MKTVDRRGFLKSAATMTTGVALSGPLVALSARVARGDPITGGGYGPLVDMGDIWLPEGFQYRIISATQRIPGFPGTTFAMPTKFDGMAAFSGPNQTTILLRNHENNSRMGPPTQQFPQEVGVVVPQQFRYDPLQTHNDVRVYNGGVTKLTVANRRVVRTQNVLGGTLTNCAGGKTPWGSWISCEEAFQNGGAPHGYTFEADAFAGPQAAIPIKSAGRFEHEAVAWLNGALYETEDDTEASFYRYVPDSLPTEVGDLAAGTGKLYALAAVGKPRLDTRTGSDPANGWNGEPVQVEWVVVDFPEPAGNGARANPPGVRFQAQAKGAAIFARTEGCWEVGGRIVFDCTTGGPATRGQIWELDPVASTLTMVYQSTDQAVLNRPDNLTQGPRGNVFLCEDAGFRVPPTPTFQMPHIRGLTAEGTIFDFAMAEANGTEFCGACFDDSQLTLYVNQQGSPVDGVPGVTYAIWGPW